MRIYWPKSPLLLGALVMGVGVGAAVLLTGTAQVGERSATPRGPSGGAPALGLQRGTLGSVAPARTPPVVPSPALRAAPALGSAPAVRPAAASTAPVRELVFRLGWGSGPQELGHKTPEEAAPEGPMSFAMGPGDSIWVLDQVNFRVQVVERGRVARSIPLLNDTYQDLAVDARGRLALVDRLALRHVAYLDGAGQAWRFTDIEGPGLPEGGGVTALFLRPDGVWLEWAHTHLVRVADGRGVPDSKRPVRWGRFSADAKRLYRATKAGSHGAMVLSRDARAARAGVEVLARPLFGRPLTALTALGSFGNGRVVLGALITRTT